jgi:hypothetical protein
VDDKSILDREDRCDARAEDVASVGCEDLAPAGLHAAILELDELVELDASPIRSVAKIPCHGEQSFVAAVESAARSGHRFEHRIGMDEGENILDPPLVERLKDTADYLDGWVLGHAIKFGAGQLSLATMATANAPSASCPDRPRRSSAE